MTRTQLQEILELPVPERLRVAEAIWDSLEETEHAEVPLSDAQREVLDRRLAAFLDDPEDTLTWPELKARVQRRL